MRRSANTKATAGVKRNAPLSKENLKQNSPVRHMRYPQVTASVESMDSQDMPRVRNYRSSPSPKRGDLQKGIAQEHSSASPRSERRVYERETSSMKQQKELERRKFEKASAEFDLVSTFRHVEHLFFDIYEGRVTLRDLPEIVGTLIFSHEMLLLNSTYCTTTSAKELNLRSKSRRGTVKGHLLSPQAVEDLWFEMVHGVASPYIGFDDFTRVLFKYGANVVQPKVETGESSTGGGGQQRYVAPRVTRDFSRATSATISSRHRSASRDKQRRDPSPQRQQSVSPQRRKNKNGVSCCGPPAEERPTSSSSMRLNDHQQRIVSERLYAQPIKHVTLSFVDKRAKEQKEERDQCTFQPKIHAYHKPEGGESDEDGILSSLSSDEENEEGVKRRTNMSHSSQHNKKKKLPHYFKETASYVQKVDGPTEEEAMEVLERELKGATFQPKIGEDPKNISHSSSLAVPGYFDAVSKMRVTAAQRKPRTGANAFCHSLRSDEQHQPMSFHKDPNSSFSEINVSHAMEQSIQRRQQLAVSTSSTVSCDHAGGEGLRDKPLTQITIPLPSHNPRDGLVVEEEAVIPIRPFREDPNLLAKEFCDSRNISDDDPYRYFVERTIRYVMEQTLIPSYTRKPMGKSYAATAVRDQKNRRQFEAIHPPQFSKAEL